ncbi:MAG: 3-oxoacyl-ACP reductase FabG [Victivallales bacterium]|nr:3-oxoacyl-ACP reductase FabG [Victivallales bacterium]
MLKYDFAGQTAIVTGGTRGIGAAITTALLQAGARVMATFASNAQAADKFRQSLPADLADRLETASFDVSDYETCEQFFHEFDATHPSLDILVHSAGIRQDAVTAMMPRETWQRVLDVNLGGAFNMAKLATLRMVSRRYGRILLLTSPVGRLGFAGQANYGASKAGLVALAKSLAKETARRKITVNCLSPGFIDTDFIATLPEEQRQEYQKLVPERRFGRPEEVANAALFLLSEEAEYITGTVLEISGGL